MVYFDHPGVNYANACEAPSCHSASGRSEIILELPHKGPGGFSGTLLSSLERCWISEGDHNQMKISDWLDEKEEEKADVSHIELPADMSFDEAPEETLYFKEIKPCGFLCTGNHPFSTVERFGHWYYGRGQDKKAGIHSSSMKWRLFTRDKDVALQTAKAHIE